MEEAEEAGGIFIAALYILIVLVLVPYRYGTCELMIACVAKAKSYEIMVNTAEV